MPLQDGGSWQQNLMCNEPSCGAIEQHAGLIGARPAQSVKPSIESELDRAVRKIRISAALADSYRMIPSVPTRAVFAETCRILDAQLSSKDRQHRSRSLCQVFWKRSEISHRTELHREAESIVIAAIHGNETAIAVIQVEIARYVL
jgi:hypothetical protein